MQRFARVDVAEPADDALIEQRDLERYLLAAACARERCAVNSGDSGSGPIALSDG